MKMIKHIYADISEINVKTYHPEYSFYLPSFAYKVNLITEYDIILFGKTFRKTKIKEIPFLFKSLNIAKDFCEINPKYKKVYFHSNDGQYSRSVKFYTYQLVVNRKVIGYIWWSEHTICIDNGHDMLFKYNNDSIINGFVKSIKVKKWVDTNNLSDIAYYGFTDKLSDLVKTIDNNEKHWRFELIENK